MGTTVTDLADRSASQDYEVLEKLRASVIAYRELVTKAGSKVVRWRKNSGCSRGCDTCEEEEEVVRAGPV